MAERTVNLHFDCERLRGDDGEVYWEFRLPGHHGAFGIAKTPDAFMAFIGAIVDKCQQGKQGERLVAINTKMTTMLTCHMCDERTHDTCVVCHKPVCWQHALCDDDDAAMVWCDDCEERSIANRFLAEAVSEKDE